MQKNDSSKKGILSAVIWKVLERFFSQGISLVVQILLARILLPEDFGNLAIIVAITNFLSIFVQSGIATVIVQRNNIDDLDIGTLQTASVVVAAFLYIILFFSAPYIERYYGYPEICGSLRVLGLLLFFNAFYSIQNAILTREMRFRQIFTVSAVSVVVSGAVGITMAVLGAGVWALVMQILLHVFVMVVIMSFDRRLRVPFRFSFNRAKDLYGFAGKILLTSIITSSHDALRTMVVGKVHSAESLAYYDKAYSYSSYVAQIANSSISSVLLPVFSRAQDDYCAIKETARSSVRMTTLIMFPLLLGVATIAQPVVTILLTEKWLPCSPFLSLFCILRIPGCLMSIDRQVYYAIGKSEINLKYEIFLISLNVATLFFTVGISPMAIAIGATIVELLGGFIIFLISQKVYAYSLKERFIDLFKPLLSSVIMVMAVSFVGTLGLQNMGTMVIQIVVGVITYGLMCLLLKNQEFFLLINSLCSAFFKKKSN